MVDNKIQFSVVREDPRVEVEILKKMNAKRILLIASGGCTALSLQTAFPNLQQTALDPNLNQLQLVQEKIKALAISEPQQFAQTFNIENESPQGLNQNGNFESLFRGLKSFIYEFVVSREDLEKMFRSRSGREAIFKKMTSSKYWPVAFQMYFSDAILNAMFGKEATQHAIPGSYPGYFQKVFERGLSTDEAYDNYFLHHILLGHYIRREESLPIYLTQKPQKLKIEFVNGYFQDVHDLNTYDFVQFSNIFDWMHQAEVKRIAEKANLEMKPGATILFRQLNNEQNCQKYFEKFKFDGQQANLLHSMDRSLFYNRVNIGVKHV